MSGNKFVFTGLEELKAELRALPAELAGEAGLLIEIQATRAGAAIKAEYNAHRDTGNLADHVVVEEREAGRFGAAFVVKSTAKHAWLFDNGSQARHYITKSGAQHDTGAMWGKTPPTHIFAGTMARARRKMYGELRGLLTRHGLTVTGEP